MMMHLYQPHRAETQPLSRWKERNRNKTVKNMR